MGHVKWDLHVVLETIWLSGDTNGGDGCEVVVFFVVRKDTRIGEWKNVDEMCGEEEKRHEDGCESCHFLNVVKCT